MKKIKLLILFFLLFSSFYVYASTNVEIRTKDDLKIHSSIKVNDQNINNILNTPKVNEKEKVYDFANLFNDLEEKNIYNQIEKFIKLSNYDLVVVTIDENNKSDEMEYADDFYDYNYFGYDDSFSGLIILIDMDNRGVYIGNAGFAIKMYDDYRINQIIDNNFDFILDKKYANAIMRMISDIENYYQKGFPSSNDNLVIDKDNVYYKENKTIIDYIKWPFIISVIITLIVVIIMYNKTRLKIKSNNVVSYLVNEQDVNINKNFLRSNVTRVRINDDHSSSGGSFHSSGGGSSFHTSSSGRSHGGGGRRF